MSNELTMNIRSLQDAAPLNRQNAHALLETLLSRAVTDPLALDAEGIMLYGDPVSVVEIKPAQEQTFLPPEMMVNTPTIVAPEQAYYMAAKLYYFAVTGEVCIDGTIAAFPGEPELEEALRRMTDVNPDARLLGVQAARQVLGKTMPPNPFQNISKHTDVTDRKFVPRVEIPLPLGGVPVPMPVPMPARNTVGIPYPPVTKPDASKMASVPKAVPQPVVPPVQKPVNTANRLYWLCMQQGQDLLPLMELTRSFHGVAHAELNPGCNCTLMVVSTDHNQNNVQVHKTMAMKLPLPFPGGKVYLRLCQGNLSAEVRDLRTGATVAQEVYDLRQEVPA